MASYTAALWNASVEITIPIAMRPFRAKHIEMITDRNFRTNNSLHERARKYRYFIP